MFTEDWVLVEMVEPAWPKLVAVGAQVTEQDWHVQIRPARGQGSHPLLRGVFVPPINLDDYDFEDDEDEQKFIDGYDPSQEDDPEDDVDPEGHTGVDEREGESAGEIEDPEIEIVKHTWKIDHESHVIKVKNKKRVLTLITSNELKRKTGTKEVVILFDYKRGHVMHLLSHFGKQNSVQNEATIENLLVNWLMQVHIYLQ